MLDLIRRKQKSTVIKFVFWLIIAAFIGTIFLVWGKGSDGSDGSAPNVAAKVNGTIIPLDQYQMAHRNLYQFYQGIYRDQFTPALEKKLRIGQQALDQLVEDTLILQAAEEKGIEVSKKEIVEAIAAFPAFQENGAFSKNRYIEVLNYQRMTPTDFEQIQEDQLKIKKMKASLEGQITVDDAEIQQEYRTRNEKVNLSFLRLTPALFESKVKVSDKDLENFFAEHREEFRLPETLSLRYIQFDPNTYRKDVAFDDGELEKYYRRNLDKFEIQEQVKAAHILIKLDPSADAATKETKRQLAQDILNQVKAGGDFAQLARKHSDDSGSAAQGGSLGYFTRGTMVPSFEKAAFALKPGETSELVESPFGFHIIRSEGYIEAGIKPLADVAEEVKTALRTQKSEQLAFEKAMDAYNINRKQGSIETAATANNLGLKETGFFSRQDSIDGIGDAADIANAAFALSTGELGRPVAFGKSVFLFTVKERKESRLPELSEVKPRVEDAYRAGQSDALAKATADSLLKKLLSGDKLEQLARGENLTADETGLFSRSYGDFVPRLGASPDLSTSAFSLTKEAPTADKVFELDGKYVLIQLRDHQEADAKGLDAATTEEIRQTVLTKKRTEAIQGKLKELKEKASISYAPALQSLFTEE